MAPDVMKRLKPLLDAGMDLAQMTPAKAEAIVKELVKQGEVRRHEAAAVAQLLVDRGREATAKVADLVRSEVTKQLDVLIGQVEMLEQRVADLTTRVKARAESGRGGTTPGASSKAPADAAAEGTTEAPAEKAPAKKAAPKKAATPAKKAAPKKAAPKKAAPKTAAPKQSAGKRSSD